MFILGTIIYENPNPGFQQLGEGLGTALGAFFKGRRDKKDMDAILEGVPEGEREVLRGLGSREAISKELLSRRAAKAARSNSIEDRINSSEEKFIIENKNITPKQKHRYFQAKKELAGLEQTTPLDLFEGVPSERDQELGDEQRGFEREDQVFDRKQQAAQELVELNQGLDEKTAVSNFARQNQRDANQFVRQRQLQTQKETAALLEREISDIRKQAVGEKKKKDAGGDFSPGINLDEE